MFHQVILILISHICFFFFQTFVPTVSQSALYKLHLLINAVIKLGASNKWSEFGLGVKLVSKE